MTSSISSSRVTPFEGASQMARRFVVAVAGDQGGHCGEAPVALGAAWSVPNVPEQHAVVTSASVGATSP